MGNWIKGFLMVLLMSMPLAITANDFNAGRQAARQHEAAPQQQSQAFDPNELSDYTAHPPQEGAWPNGDLNRAGHQAAEQSEVANSLEASAHQQGVCARGHCPEGAASDRMGQLKRVLSGKAAQPMFHGKPRHCRTWRVFNGKGYQTVNCCRGTDSADGGLIHHGVYQCTQGEKHLRQARQAGRAVSVGQYCARRGRRGDHPTICLEKRHAYCVFDDAKAARLQTGARDQLGRDFGSPESPDCHALSPETLRKLDYEALGLPSVTQSWRDRGEISQAEWADWREGDAELTGACAGGDCPHDQHEPDSDVGSVVSALKGTVASGRDLDDQRQLFAGKRLQCREVSMGYSNCCQDHGWGQDMGLAQCSDEEKRLGQAKQDGRVVYLGRYCAHESDLGLGSHCWEHKRAYCVFPNKLGQIIQKQGREDQLGVSLGDAQTPNCRAITPDELQRMDLDAMDWDELTDQWRHELNSTNPEHLKKRLKQQMQEQQRNRRQSAPGHGGRHEAV